MEVVTASTVASSLGNQVRTAACPVGKKAVGGGATIAPTGIGIALEATAPVLVNLVPVGWTAQAFETVPTDANWSLTVYAICVANGG